MKIENIIKKAQLDISEKGYTSYHIIRAIKNNMENSFNDYDFQDVCIDCHNEIQAPDSDDYNIDSRASVSRLRDNYNFIINLDRNCFSWSHCSCCSSKLGGERFFYICYNQDK